MSTECKVVEGIQGIKSHSKASSYNKSQPCPFSCRLGQLSMAPTEPENASIIKHAPIARIAVASREQMPRGTGQHTGMEIKAQVQC